ncbi:GntP family permease [Microbacterium sp. Marseille-Q6965]|uniref:GntP family permease n=1 Tax=Microbacterium sp. Marseille-Q6965 TaxID=2965072 RepID=UPI0021B82374|nr:GntP family permease [Microbacterium sp. Marseille-Q6965]
MADWQILTVTAVAILAVVLLIVKLRVNPVVALVLGAAGLGLMSGLGVTDTIDTVMHGFGDILFEVGLLIGWGVLMGALLNEMGAIQRLVAVLFRAFGKRGVPYAFGVTLGTALQSIFLDVLLVMSAPLAKRIAPRLGRNGVGKLSAAMAIGLECGIVLMVPGVAAVSLAGLLKVPLGIMLLCGLLVIVPTILAAIFTMNVLFDRGFWKPEKDEQPRDDDGQDEALAEAGAEPASANGSRPLPIATSTGGVSQLTKVGMLPRAGVRRQRDGEAPLVLLFAPMLLSLVLIAGGALLEMAGVVHPVVEFLSAPVIALLIGLLGTSVVARYTVGGERVEKGLATGFRESGQILLLTGAGGSLAAIVGTSGMGDLLGRYFTASTVAPLIVVWAVAAVLHVAVGSVSISAITAAGILAPIAGQIGLNPVLIALAAGAGSLFLVHVTSNTFWLLQSMLGQTTAGTFKTCSIGVSVASVYALVFTLILGIFI